MFTWMEITQFPKHKTLMISPGNYTFTSTFVYMHHEFQYTNQSQYLWQCNTVVYFFWLVSTISICVTSRVFIYSVSFAARKAYVGPATQLWWTQSADKPNGFKTRCFYWALPIFKRSKLSSSLLQAKGWKSWRKMRCRNHLWHCT